MDGRLRSRVGGVKNPELPRPIRKLLMNDYIVCGAEKMKKLHWHNRMSKGYRCM
jgi:hypothetical protein